MPANGNRDTRDPVMLGLDPLRAKVRMGLASWVKRGSVLSASVRDRLPETEGHSGSEWDSVDPEHRVLGSVPQ